MAKEIPSASEWQPGGAKVIGIHVSPCPSPAAEIALPRNPIPPLKKKDSGFHTSVLLQLRWLSAAQDRSPRQRNPPNTVDTEWFLCWRNTIGNGGGNGASVTTSHVFWPNQQRKGTSLLPIWLRNSGILVRRDGKAQRGGEGGSAGRNRHNRLIHKLTRNFLPNGSPALFYGQKNNADSQRRHPDADVGDGDGS